MPTGHVWIEKPPRSSSRMSSTHALDSVRPSQEAQTPRRSADDDPLRRTPPERSRRGGAPVRPRRICNRERSPSTPSRVRRTRRGWRSRRGRRRHRLPEVPHLRPRPRRRGPRHRADRTAAGRLGGGRDDRRGQPGGAAAAVRAGDGGREPRRRARQAGLDRSTPGRVPGREGRLGADDRDPSRVRGPHRRQPRVRVHRGHAQADRRPPGRGPSSCART